MIKSREIPIELEASNSREKNGTLSSGRDCRDRAEGKRLGEMRSHRASVCHEAIHFCCPRLPSRPFARATKDLRFDSSFSAELFVSTAGTPNGRKEGR